MQKKVSRTTARVVGEMRYLSQALDEGLVNYSALARVITPRLEKELGYAPSSDAVIAAIRRHAKTDKKTISKHFASLMRSMKLSIRTDLVDVHFNYSTPAFDKLCALCKRIDWSHGEKIVMIPRSSEISVIAKASYLQDVLACVPKKDLLGASRNRALITLSYDPDQFSKCYGGLQYLTGQFGALGIVILLMVCSWSQTSFLVDESDVLASYRALSEALASVTEP